MKRFYKEYAAELWLTVFGAVVVILTYVSGIGCFIKRITGVDCITCGMTRAFISLLHGDIRGAFYFHPLFWSAPAIYLVLFFRKKLSGRFLIVFTAAALLLFVAVYLLRLFVFENSLIYLEV